MKKTLIILALTFGYHGNCQLKIPSRGTIKKEVKEVLSSDKSNDKSSNIQKTETAPETKSPNTEEINSPAKAQISGFWKQIEKMRSHTKEDNKQVVFSSGIQSAKMALKNTKAKDPNYDTSQMEQALQECENIYNGVAGGKQNKRDLYAKTLAMLQLFFDTQNVNLTKYAYTSQESDKEKIDRVKANMDSIAKYKKMADAFVVAEKDQVVYDDVMIRVLNIATKSFQSPVTPKEKWPGGLRSMNILEDPTNSWSLGIFTFVQEIKIKEAYFYAAKVIYPNQPAIIKAHEWCVKAVDQIGTTEQVLAKINKSESDYLKKVKFPSAKVNDATLEAEFKKHFNAMGYDETITKVNIQSADWTIDRNELTGVIVGRSKQAFIATKKPNGDCYVTEFWIFQDYNGSGYGSFRNVTNNSFRSKIDCANIK